MNNFEKLKAEIASVQSAIFAPITAILESAEDDAQKYYTKGVRSAGNRLKKKMQDIMEQKIRTKKLWINTFSKVSFSTKN
jgi:hypothetical protein